MRPPGTPYRPRRPGAVTRERPRATPVPEDNANEFRKPNLPSLEGTPSARRQYTYGAAEEPSPARPVLRGDIVDLSGAVQGALHRHEQRRVADERRQSSPNLFLEEAERQDDDQESRQKADQLSMPPPSFKPAQDPPSTRVDFVPLTEPGDDSDADDIRSFATESEFFDDASIVSAPASTTATEARQKFSAMLQRKTAEPQLPGSPELPALTPVRPRPSSILENERPSSPSTQGTPGLRSNPRRPKQSKRTAIASGFQQPKDATSPAESRRPPQMSFAPRLNGTKSLPTDRKMIPVESTVRAGKRLSARLESTQRTPLRQRSGNSDHGIGELEDETEARPSLFAQAKSFAASVSPFSTRSYYAADHSEMDDAMQREIESNESESVEGEHGWTWLRPLTSLPHIRRRMPHGSDDMLDNINWWQLLNPYTYFKASWWFAREAYLSTLGSLRNPFPQRLMDRLVSSLGPMLYFTAAVIVLITLVSVGHAALFGKASGDLSMDRLLSMPEIRWPNLGSMTGKAHEFLPAFSWPTWGRSSLLPDLTQLDNDGLARLDEYLKQYQREFERIQQASKLHDSSLKKLEAVVPKLVHIQLENGKPVVAQEFWHALRDLIHRDGDFLTFEQKGNKYEVASEAHWKAIASRINKDPTFTKQINITMDSTVKSMEQRVKQGAAGFWEAWIKNNDAKISDMLGSALDEIQTAGSQREFDKRLQRIVKEHIDESNKDSSVISREEFLRHFKNEFATHRAEVRSEVAELQPQLENMVRQAAELVGKEAPESMSKAEIVTLVHGMVNKAVADMNLEAMARGQIHSHWDSVLRHQINYFGVGAGATIDAQHVSPTFDPPKDSSYVKQKGLRGVQTPIPRVAIEPWSDEGDCWCAARSENPRGNPHGVILPVQLGHRIVPQHIVVEHIVAGATTDPDARPKEIEVYADIDADLRELVRDFSAIHFPDIYPLDEEGLGWNVSPVKLPERFVKIGQFVYEDIQPHDGVQVHRLSDELLNLGVATDHVIVRAVSNYGSKTHTCFYRVRLYGKRMDEHDDFP
ncbi:spindle pole body-associated protein sad1 [Cordyceps militaris CM01]|uniref:Spindle pole body-associated protein sad1 n=1 Tax=Cordyceps militaris (strain CM01) TaxID=983644 RepID=G3JQ82_CORMM|nr:spindle pole body-associated protein sad1 [Cordyceps militaris CM01]EGX89333.1 spindle pole body-associated protein sad1 [Cordyceps militaris CM01]